MGELSNDQDKAHLGKGTQSPPNLTDGEKHMKKKPTNDIFVIPLKGA